VAPSGKRVMAWLEEVTWRGSGGESRHLQTQNRGEEGEGRASLLRGRDFLSSFPSFS
jgi:hypothetical protein